MKTLITGGCGFVGTNIATSLQQDGNEVLLIDNLARYGAFENLAWLRGRGDVGFSHCDVRSENDVVRAVEAFQPDVIYHLAGQVAMTTSIANPRRDFEVNALGTFNVLEAVRQHVPEAVIVYASTNKVYGDLEYLEVEETPTRYALKGLPEGVDEYAQIDFHSPYGCSKGTGDQYMLDYHRIYGLKTVVLRHSTIYGGRQFATYDQGWIGWFCQEAVRQAKGDLTPFTISGTGKQVRDLLHSRDVVRLYQAIPKSIDQCQGQAFNIGGGKNNSFSLLELFSFLEEKLSLRLRYEQLPPRESDQRVFIADTTAVRNATGWSPEVSREQGVQEMIEWVQALA